MNTFMFYKKGDCFYNCFYLLEVMKKMRWNYNINLHDNCIIKAIAGNQEFQSFKKHTNVFMWFIGDTDTKEHYF